MAALLTRLSHKTAIQLHLVAESDPDRWFLSFSSDEYRGTTSR